MAPVGVSQLLANGEYAVNAAVWKYHQNYLRGLHHFLCTDERVPEKFRQQTAQTGLDKRHHPDTQGGLQLLSDDRSAFLLDFSIENKLIIEEGNREILECLKKNVNRLTFQQREVIFHIIYHDLNYAETAAIMDLSKKSICNLFSSAIISLRDKFKKDYSHKIQISEIVILLTTYKILH